MACVCREQDFFVTRGKCTSSLFGQIEVEQYTRESAFVQTVQSVILPSNGGAIAYVVDRASNWVAIGPVKDAQTGQTLWSKLTNGMLVRFGTAAGGYTDYFTILEVKSVFDLHNSTASALQVSSDPAQATIASGASYSATFGAAMSGEATLILRLNGSIDLTSLPTGMVTDATIGSVPGTLLTLANRYTDGGFFLGTGTENSPLTAINPQYSNICYPSFVREPWPVKGANSCLKVFFNAGTKRVYKISLMGYAITSMPAVGHAVDNEPTQEEDYVVLRIEELSKLNVTSNVPHANGAFAVLPVSSSTSNSNGTHSTTMFEPTADKEVASVEFESPVALGRLTLSLTNRLGSEVQMLHGHFWLRVTMES